MNWAEAGAAPPGAEAVFTDGSRAEGTYRLPGARCGEVTAEDEVKIASRSAAL